MKPKSLLFSAEPEDAVKMRSAEHNVPVTGHMLLEEETSWGSRLLLAEISHSTSVERVIHEWTQDETRNYVIVSDESPLDALRQELVSIFPQMKNL